MATAPNDGPALAVLKGIIEHHDSSVYFGSLMGLRHHIRTALEAGWIGADGLATPEGKAVYEDRRLAELPKRVFSRWYLWDWPNNT